MSNLVEFVKANDFDVYEYLKYLLDEMPNRDFKNHPEISGTAPALVKRIARRMQA